ncbi:MAG: FtsX-like permease family protein [Victivallaceae bacterium]|nr:FtsX-like permease family protein [Victivallaceae bacterium]
MHDSFNTLALVKRNLGFYRRQTLQVILAIVLTTAIISGAFLIGTSVKNSLKTAMNNRLGQVTYALFQTERWFKADLGQRLSNSSERPCSALISVPAYMTGDNGQTIKVNLYGVESSFFQFAPQQNMVKIPAPGEALINRTAAIMAGLKPGKGFAVRCFKPSLMPGDTAWSSRDSSSVGFRLQVVEEISPAAFSDFNPLNTQLAPANVFVDRDWLAERLGRSGRANVLLYGGTKPPLGLNDKLKLADYGLNLKKLPNGAIELKSDRVFISPTVVKAAASLKLHEQSIFSYFANSITAHGKMTPYSFVTGVKSLGGRTTQPRRSSSGVVAPPSLSIAPSNREAVINSWLANDLKLKVGDDFAIAYYKFGANGELQEDSATFKVKAIIPVSNAPELMPKFPGMSNAASCNDWDPGIPINLKLIRAKDEAYWNKYRGTPKLFIALDRAQKLWGCRFGKLTAIRFSDIKQKKQLSLNVEHRMKEKSLHSQSTKRNNNASNKYTNALLTQKDLEKSLLQALTPAELGFSWQPLNSIGRHGVANAVDFSGLFFGLSFFVIIAGIVLSGLLYRLHLEQRISEFAVLKAMGFANHHLRRILMLEAGVGLIAGIAVGIVAAFGYSYLIIGALNTVWNSIAGSIQVSLHAGPQVILLGAGITVPVIAMVMFFALRKVLANDLQGSLVKTDFHHTGSRFYLGFGIIALLAGTVIILIGIKSADAGVGTFFGAAALLFAGMVCLSGVIIRSVPEWLKGHGISTLSTALRNNSRHFRRSMAVVVIMALGIFLTLAVSVNRTKNRGSDASKKSGTGGFGWYIETVIPVKGNLNSAAGRQRYRLKIPATEQSWLRRNVEHSTSNVQHRMKEKQLLERSEGRSNSLFVQLPMMDGGAAGCLNLNRVTRPRLLGVPPEVFDDRFSFQTPDATWSSLQQNDTEVIPAIADQNVILWSLGLKIGDTLDYPGANGKIYKLKFIAGLNNSILQGAVLISRANLRRMFPDISGNRVLLVEQSSNEAAVATAISYSLAKLGPDIETGASRLNRFGAIQNSYLMVFLSLGGIGLIIGTLGLSIILRRNLLERRGELAWLRSAGFSRRRIAFMLTVEHIILFDCAVLTGVIAAAAAAIPAMLSPSGSPPWAEMILLLCVLWIFALIFIVTAAYSATKGNIISGLRVDAE